MENACNQVMNTKYMRAHTHMRKHTQSCVVAVATLSTWSQFLHVTQHFINHKNFMPDMDEGEGVLVCVTVSPQKSTERRVDFLLII